MRQPPWLREKTWLGAEGVEAKHNAELARRAGLKSLPKDVDLNGFLALDAWKGSNVEQVERCNADRYWGPLSYIENGAGFMLDGVRFHRRTDDPYRGDPEQGPSNGKAWTESIITHTSGAVARLQFGAIAASVAPKPLPPIRFTEAPKPVKVEQVEDPHRAAFLELIHGASPITRKELEALIKRRPEVWGKYSNWLPKLRAA